MKRGTAPAKSIDAYIRSHPGPVQQKLRELRKLVRQEAPDSREKISYRMPAFFLNRTLVYFAAYARHIGFYPGAGAVIAFKSKISKYKHAKGSIQFPLDKPLPAGLIREIVRFRVAGVTKKSKQ
jgi:uncharacterized protein YdhG (YjbR/CyaY superfamily)